MPLSWLYTDAQVMRCCITSDALRLQWATCRNGPLLTEWALMEAAEGNVEEARGIFSRGALGSPHAPLLIAWAELEQDNGRHAQ